MRWRIEGRAQAETPPSAPGVYDIETALAGNRRARFTLAVPHAGRPAAPLVVVLHYAGQPTRYYGRPLLEHLIGPALAPLYPVCVAPESLGGAWPDAANEAWVLELTEAVAQAYAVDRRRVVVTGYSMGALGTWHFVSRHPQVFAAGIPIAGFPSHDLACEVPVHAYHAARDELFPLARLEGAIAAARARGGAIELSLAEARGHYDIEGYRDALADAVGWLERVWSQASAAPGLAPSSTREEKT